ncbi:MAG: class I SAM-dependent methyltransferase [Planctomycetes bacterium]|nr:class I SAM-dependent methyltransferase [Planctomycetota bacterium]
MVLGPAFGGQRNDQVAAGSSEEVAALVRAAAEELVEDLHRAEKSTDGWSERPLTEALVDAALSRCLARLAETNVWGEANRAASSELWRIAGSLLDAGVLQHCARFKPRGYAGDFEMLARICRHYRCEDPLGSAFDRFFQHQAAPEAVRSRTEQIAAALVSDCLARDVADYHVVSVGAGPGLDVRAALTTLPESRRSGVRVTLVDLDPEALDFARREIEPLLPASALTCTRTNLFRIPQAPDRAVEAQSVDFLICSGMFDYLEDEPAGAMLKTFWEWLTPGGMLLVGNFAPHNPTRAYMEWIGNWYLLYRTRDELAALSTRAGIPGDQATVGSERLGVDLFLAARRGHPPAGTFFEAE